MGKQILVGSNFNFKNRIINGDFKVNQRRDTLVSNESKYPIDRVFTEAIDSEVTVSDEIIYSITEGSMVDDINPFNDGSLVAMYKLDGDATDALGNYNASWYGTEQYDTFKFGQGAYVDGSSGIYSEAHAALNDTMSLSLWFKLINISNEDDHNIIFNAGEYICELGISKYDGKSLYFASGDEWSWRDTGIDLEEKVDYHIVTTYTRSTGLLEIFLNGKKIVSYKGNPSSNEYGNLSDSITFGYRRDNDNQTPRSEIVGYFDQIRICNRLLTEDEIKKFYAEDYKYIQKNHLKVEIKSKGINSIINPYVYKFEGQHILDIVKGSMNLSFDFYSSKTGSYSLKLVTECLDGTQETFETTFDYTGYDFEKIEINIPERTFVKDIIGDERLGATLYIAGNAENNVDTGDSIRLANVQLEKGNKATEFEHVPYDIQLQRCMRYYEKDELDTIRFFSTDANQVVTSSVNYKVVKRTSPTIKYNIIQFADFDYYQIYNGENIHGFDIQFKSTGATATGYVYYSWESDAEL